MNFDDKLLFLEAMEDVIPLKTRDDNQWFKPCNTPSNRRPEPPAVENFFTTDFLDILPLDNPLLFKREGIQAGVLEKLRKGKYPREMTINLLRMTVEQCRQGVFNALRHAQAVGARNLLIIHGKGREERAHPNIIRSFLDRWLKEFGPVQAYCCALPHHGGSGACYVALSKSPEARLHTREMHAKRSR